jgi:hypothetical protein
MKEFNDHHPEISTFLMSRLPGRNTVENPSLMFDRRKLKCQVNALDTAVTTKQVPFEWYWNNAHVLSILNEAYNHMLVETICPFTKVEE